MTLQTKGIAMPYFLIGYDIRSPRRLQRIHRKLLCFAIPIQYSVFLFTGTEESVKHCLSVLKPLLNEREDDLRCYRLPASGVKARLGTAVLPEGIFYTELPSGL